MTRLAVPAAVLLAMVAAWLSLATLAVASPDGPRIALLPVSLPAILCMAAAGILVASIARFRSAGRLSSGVSVQEKSGNGQLSPARSSVSLAPLWLLVLVLLPWLPMPVPAAFLAWAGAIRFLVWFGVAVLIAAPFAISAGRSMRSTAVSQIVTSRPRLCAGTLAFAIFALSAWLVAPSIPGGDEPHYLVITQSLLLDRDLQIENNHRRGDYQAYYPGALAPHYIQRGRNGQIYSIHAPGLSAIVAPAFAIGGYRGVVVFLMMLSACGSALAWHLAWLATGRPAAAWFGWAAVTLAATTVFHSFTVYPDGLGGIIALTGVWGILRAARERTTGATRLVSWFLHGAALALLPWIHSRFALLAGSLGALVLLRLSATKSPAGKAVAFLSVPAISALGWVSFFVAIYGRADPSAPYGAASSREFSIAFIPGGLTGLFFDQRFGLVANAPVLVFAFVGLWLMVRGENRRAMPSSGGLADWRLSLELLFVIVPYLLTATSYAMWWAGWSAPARFANPAVYALAIPCAVVWARFTSDARRPARTVAAGALVLTIFLSAVLVGVDGGRLAYNTRETTALWLDWASRLTSLGEGMPVWYRGREGALAGDVVIWGVAMVVAFACARALSALPVLRNRVRYATAVAGMYAAASMVALSVVWFVRGVDGVMPAPAQFDLLRRLATEPHLLLVQVDPPRGLSREGILAGIRIESETRAGGTAVGRPEQPLVMLPSIPAGRYRVTTRSRGPGGWLMIGVGQDQFSLRSGPMTYPPAPIDIELPVDVRSLSVRGDEDTRRALRSVAIEPLSLVPPADRVTDLTARRAVTYEGASVFFLDGDTYPEPEAFWIAGARQASFVVQTVGRGASIRVRVRNAPIANRITLTSRQWREDLTLGPGDERQLEIPLAPGHTAALVTVASAAGFRPSEAVAGSRDQRFLGVWVRIGE